MIANKTFSLNRLSLITTTIASVGLTLANLAPANAALLTIAVNGGIDSGDLLGANYTGTFSFEEPVPNYTGTISVVPLSITFNNPPDSATYTEADAVSPPLVEYFEGNLLGLEFAVDNAQLGTVTFNFAFVPGFPSDPVTEASLVYDVKNGTGGTGSAEFSAVPDPTSMLASFGVLGLVGYCKRRRKVGQKSLAGITAYNLPLERDVSS
jgi:hypothetical protein